jgi:hypothetical protein
MQPEEVPFCGAEQPHPKIGGLLGVCENSDFYLSLVLLEFWGLPVKPGVIRERIKFL